MAFQNWVFVANGSSTPQPPLQDGTVYIGSHDGHFVTHVRMALQFGPCDGGEVRSSPAIGGDGQHYVASNDNKLYSISSTGTTNWDVRPEVIRPTIRLTTNRHDRPGRTIYVRE